MGPRHLRVLGFHMVKFGFLAELGDQGNSGTRAGGAKRGTEEFGPVTFHCIVTDNVVWGGPGGEREGEGRAKAF